MKKLFNIESDYDRGLVKALWYAWQDRSQGYTDASGVTMAMDIESAFKAVLSRDEWAGIPTAEAVQPQAFYAKAKTFIEIGLSAFYGGHRTKEKLTIEQARLLRDELDRVLKELGQ